MTEAIGIVLRIPTNHGNECEAEYNGKQENLPNRKPKLRLSIVVDCKNVDHPNVQVK